MNPVSVMPIAHSIWDPHFGLSINDAYSPLILMLFIIGSGFIVLATCIK